MNAGGAKFNFGILASGGFGQIADIIDGVGIGLRKLASIVNDGRFVE